MQARDWRLGLTFLLLLAFTVAASARAGQTPGHAKSYAAYIDIPGATRVTDDTCAMCHDDVAKRFQTAFHRQQGVACEDCHGNGSLHVNAGGDTTKIVDPAKRTAEAANGICLRCHVRNDQIRHWLAGPHAANHVRCIDCHQVHADSSTAADAARAGFAPSATAAASASLVSPESSVKLRARAATNEACLGCHEAERAQLDMPYHHPLREGKMSCVDCHDPHGGPAGNNLPFASTNQLCLSCHAQYRGPFAYQHPPVTENCLNCHSPHGSPNTNLLSVSEPALCLQCHASHHNGAGLPIVDRCTNCHSSIHGTDIATPSGGSRWIDKGPYGVPSEPPQPVGLSVKGPAAAKLATMLPVAPVASHVAAYGIAAGNAMAAMMASASAAPLSGPGMGDFQGGQVATGAGGSFSSFSVATASYRFIDGSGFLGRAGEYDSLQESAGVDGVSAFVSPRHKLTVVSRGNYLSRDDYSAAADVTLGGRLEVGFDLRSFVQQQDHYIFYTPLMSPDFAPPDGSTDTVPSHTTFGMTRRMGTAYARVAIPRIPVHAWVKGGWQARDGMTQLTYLDENATPTCGELCHHQSQLQRTNYTTRNIAVGADVDLGPVRLTVAHRYSSFSNQAPFPIGHYAGPFTPEDEGFSTVNPPPSGPAPADVAPGNYYVDVLSPSHATTDSLSAAWNASPVFGVDAQVSYTRLRNTFTGNPQNTFDTDDTLHWRPVPRLRIVADYHQHNLTNQFTPYYTLYGNVSYRNHWEGVRGDYELRRGLDAEAYYKRSDITRSNADLWPQVYSMDNTDLLRVVPSSSSNTVGLAVRYHDRAAWNARAGYERTGTDHPGFLIVPGTNQRIFGNVWIKPAGWITFASDTSIILQSAFPAIPLPNTPGDFQRRNRFYAETASVTVQPVRNWRAALGYSYQQNTLTSYMAFQNDNSVGYVIDEPAVPYKQITQAAWGETGYTLEGRLGFNARLSYNAAHSGLRPDVNPADAAQLGNAALIAQNAFDPVGFAAALGNLTLAAGQVSGVVVPQWIGQARAFYRFPKQFEGGLVFYYGRYRDQWNPGLDGTLRTFTVYIGRRW